MSRKLLVAFFAALMLGQTNAAALAAPVPGGVKAAAATAPMAAAPISATDATKVPHYFGPYPNWANSPQVLSNAIVTFSNGGGTGAEGKATVDPKTGGISAITVTSPGSGYTAAPDVAITAAGVTPAPAAATATISSGVVTSIAVVEPGFGFAAPAVTLTGGTPTSGSVAVAVASGGVDNLRLVDPGLGYANQPLVTLSLPDLPGGVQATATATMDAKGVVTSLSLADKGSGYTKAPTVTIADAGKVTPTTQATATATIGIDQIDVTDGGQGYDSAPTVAINDTVGTADKGASATATVAVKGAVTAVTVTTPGSGYLTPGLKKFVDTLPGLGPQAANNLKQYIPIAVPDTTTYPGADYYEIAVVQYRHQFSSDLPATLLRGYVQLSTSVVPGKNVPLTNANLDPTLPDAPIAGYTGVDSPHYLGPTIVANKNRPTRILFRNLLPTGVAGDLFIPVDTSVMGSGPGPTMTTLDANGVPNDMAKDEGTVTDGVRNPMCGETPKPTGCYTENRATLHLHGGITPWISDGTPHQWTTPDSETTDYPKGVSVSNVPDMPDPGPGAETFFYTNQQSARLMFYHDHSYGITRLNVYAGEAAGYLLTDPMEQSLIAPTGALAGLGEGTPLIIQDKTFVPSAAQMAKVDPTWNATKWGGEGSLWTPHVYMPAQNPGSASGASSFGRWMYGPWFWPPATDAKYPPIANPYYDPNCDPNVQPFCEPAQIPSTPNVSVGMEAFNDTPIVNGTAYPTTTVDPQAYRYRILNAANDRFWNLQWYVADPTTGTLSEVALNPAELAAAQTDPNVFPTPVATKDTVGPNFVQIGTEGGFLPATVIANQPITWITDPTRFDFGNVDKHALLLAPAERADVIVDFSQYRGKTLILYNDAPAAFPARQANQDFYTGGPDMTASGGAPTTLAGYGPNTRTIMQVKVSNAAPALAFDRPNTSADRMGALVASFAHHLDATGKPAGVFEAGSDPIIVGQAAYNNTYGLSKAAATTTPFVSSGYCSSPTAPTAKCDGLARIQQQGGDLFKFDTLGPLKDGNGPQLSIPLQPKALHDEMNSANFDEWGRMTANLGLEAPGATPLLQNIILYPYVNPATETLDATSSDLPDSLNVTPISSEKDGTQIWKITHNGVDTHPLHFHLYDVQVLNRVTWDNIIMPPDPNELGWKDTVRLSPLEDTYVAVRPIVPTLPFGVPDSIRALNPAMPLGATGSSNSPNGTEAGFNNTDANGNPTTTPIVNTVQNFGWEYVWHCHILSHEEMDMMRPVTVAVRKTLPDKPALSFAAGGLKWTDGTPVDYANLTTWVDPTRTAEVGYKIERADAQNGPFTKVGDALANATSFIDNSATPDATYYYRVTAWNAAGDSTSSVLTVVWPPKAPTNLTAVVQLDPAQPAGAKVAVNWTNNATNATNVVLERAVGNGQFSVLDATLPTTLGSYTYTDTTVLPGPYSYRVNAVNATGPSAYAGPVTVTVAKPGSTTVVVGVPNPSFVGNSVTFTATVSPQFATGTPSGQVIFTVNGTATTATLANGVATFSTTTALPAGTYPVTAAYSGDSVFAASTGLLTQTVNKNPTTTALLSSSNPSLVGQNVTFTATVSPNTATGGTAQFTVDGVAAGPLMSLVAGQASYSTSGLVAGAHQVAVTYSGDSMFATSGSSLTQTVDKNASTTALVSSSNPSLLGRSVTFTASVSSSTATTPTGQVIFTVNGTATPATLTNGVATFTPTTTLLAGLNTVTADYSGDSMFATSSGSLTQTVNVPTATVLVSSSNASVAGQSVTFTATVSAATGPTPNGLVTFNVNAMTPVTVAVDATGVATFTTNALPAGAYMVTADYAGAGVFLGSFGWLTQTVLAATTTVVTSNRLPAANFGQNVTFTATVTPVTGTGIPTGTVQFSIGGVNVGTALTLNAQGRATYSTATLAAGSHPVIATYSGSAIFAGGASATLTQVVNKVAATTSLTSSRNPSVFGQLVTFTAQVSPAAATGTVQFKIGGVNITGPMTLDATGRARWSSRTLAVGSYTLSASYSGNANYLAGSANLTQTVNKAASRTVVTSSRNPATRGTTVVFTATVTAVAPGAGIPAGTVQFRIGGVNVGALVTLNSSGKATYSRSMPTVGTYLVSAVYSGNFGMSTSGNLAQQIR